jgi:DNA-binding SARP family transcriptional activator
MHKSRDVLLTGSREQQTVPPMADPIAGASPSTTSPRVRLRLISGFELRHGDELVVVPPSSQRLVVFVALRERSVRRRYVSGALWLEASEERASANLRCALWRTPAPGGCPLLQASSTHIWLNPEVEVDFRVSMARALSVLKDGEAGASSEGLHRELLDDDLLPDWDEDWVLTERERFRQLRLHALERISQNLIDAGRYDAALQTALEAVAAEPLRESGHRLLVRVHVAEGNISEAFRVYWTYARMLAKELGVAPSAAMTDLIGSVTQPAL